MVCILQPYTRKREREITRRDGRVEGTGNETEDEREEERAGGHERDRRRQRVGERGIEGAERES